MDFKPIAKIKTKRTYDRTKEPKKKLTDIKTEVFFIKNKFKVRINNKVYPILIDPKDINKVDYIYSHIDNDQYEPWTIKTTQGCKTNLDIIIKYWSIIRPNQIVRGEIIDNKFVLNIDSINIENLKYYNRKHAIRKGRTSECNNE